jgi:hemoglobin
MKPRVIKRTCMRTFIGLSLAAALIAMCGCGSANPAKKKNQEFFTSGSPQADERAEQRMAQSEQLSGSGEGAGQQGITKAVVAQPSTNGSSDAASGSVTNKPAQVEGKLSLFERLGGETGVSNIVADFLPRAMQDPRVNWSRKEVTRGGFSFERGKSVTWNDSPENVERLKLHLIEFISLATGGPAHYDGKEMKPAHAALHISNAEFDATVGDLKASFDKLRIPNLEQKELLAIVESTRPEIVTEH